ncbi:glycosyltransferase [Pedobacter duraquae]|uniref:Glycosyltransferase involved in cell wall biosynthesis n=1 Tax=Pedobacter duraquae TaxID=425511 RepID=A0A4R6IMH5_9SPHI|nr:glycosyltransferase [Pedobacter duraquae]TDO23155.1 glycosyltransferase involved in cell wall biosynthesis [Pedobacter duraquae]
MKIAITADPGIPVPPEFYGGIERIVDLLVTGLHKRGHEVTLFAHADSKVPCRLIPYKNNSTTGLQALASNMLSINRSLIRDKQDIVHSFGRLSYLAPILGTKIPKIMSYQREPTIGQIKKAMKLARLGSLSFTGCSNYITNQITPVALAETVYNGIDLTTYTPQFSVATDAPLVFLGRIEPIKGPHTAISIALKTNRTLIIAGNIPNEHKTYFDQEIKPHLGKQITYIGAVNDSQKNVLLGNASALLMPIQWNEPFGIVMIEAMACGTPVLALNHGAIPEVIKNGLNGYTGITAEDLIEKTDLLAGLDRSAIRKGCENRFSADTIVDQYLALYERRIA